MAVDACPLALPFRPCLKFPLLGRNDAEDISYHTRRTRSGHRDILSLAIFTIAIILVSMLANTLMNIVLAAT